MDRGMVALENAERTAKDAKMYKRKQKNAPPREGSEGGRSDHHCQLQKHRVMRELPIVLFTTEKHLLGWTFFS